MRTLTRLSPFVLAAIEEGRQAKARYQARRRLEAALPPMPVTASPPAWPINPVERARLLRLIADDLERLDEAGQEAVRAALDGVLAGTMPYYRWHKVLAALRSR